MVRRTLFSHRICGRGIKTPPTLFPTTPLLLPTYTNQHFPPLLLLHLLLHLFFLFQNSPKALLSISPYISCFVPALSGSLCRDAPPWTKLGKPSVLSMCHDWLGFQSGCTCKCERYLFSPPHSGKFLHSMRISCQDSYSPLSRKSPEWLQWRDEGGVADALLSLSVVLLL